MINRKQFSAAFSLSILLVTLTPLPAQAEKLRLLTPEASIEMPRIENATGLGSGDPISYSPDGHRYLLRIAQDDLKSHGIWVDFYVGRTTSLETAKPVRLLRLFTTGKLNRRNGSTPPTHPARTRVTWVDGDRFLFLWDPGGVTQIMLGDTRTGSIDQLTHNRTSVTDFRLVEGSAEQSPTIIYSLFPELPDERTATELPQGLVVKSPDLVSTFLLGDFSGKSSWQNTTPRLLNLETRTDRALACSGPPCNWYGFAGLLAVSATGKYVVAQDVEENAKDTARFAWRVWEVDRTTASLVDRLLVGPSLIGNALWAPTADRIILGPMELEPTQGVRHFVELDPATGQRWVLPIQVPENVEGLLSPIRLVRWRLDGVVEIRKNDLVLGFRKRGEQWIQLPKVPRSTEFPRTQAPVRIDVRQSLRSSPRIVAVERKSGRERLLIDVAPELKSYSLGRVEYVEFKDREGTTWEGRLTYPTGYTPGNKYPMVIAMSGDEAGAPTFSLTGMNDQRGALYSAQSLASRGIATLSLSDRGTHGKLRGMSGFYGTSREGEKITMGFEAAVDNFVKKGLARPDKIGIAGFSRMGSFVQQAITRSTYPFAAAISSDNVGFGYVEATLSYRLGGENAAVNGAPGTGKGLRRWLQQAPPFNADNVRTPLRMEVLSGWLAGLACSWELYAQLKFLGKPVEMVIAPHPKEAIHAVQMPAQKLFSQAGMVDWFEFWLNGREDPNPAKAEQYVRWRELRREQVASKVAH